MGRSPRVIELPTIEAGLVIGTINTRSQEVHPHPDHPIYFACQLSGDCCSQLKIPVTDFDIKRIEDHGFALDQIIEVASPTLRFSKSDQGRGERNYWIKQKPFANTCTFLKDNKCSIHEFKPFGCRIFPFQLRELEPGFIEVVIHSSNLCKSVHVAESTRANNQELLTTILETVMEENKYRQQYFEQYGQD